MSDSDTSGHELEFTIGEWPSTRGLTWKQITLAGLMSIAAAINAVADALNTHNTQEEPHK